MSSLFFVLGACKIGCLPYITGSVKSTKLPAIGGQVLKYNIFRSKPVLDYLKPAKDVIFQDLTPKGAIIHFEVQNQVSPDCGHTPQSL